MQNAVQEFSVSRVIQTARSLLLPSPIPSAPPRGQQARELDIGSFHHDHPGWKLTPASLLAAFVQAEQGDPRRQCRMFNDIVSNDCTLASLLFQRRQSVAGKARVINATNETRQSMVAAKVLSTVAQEVIGTKTVEHLLGFNKYGFAASEIIWTVRRVGGRQWVVPQYFLNVPADRFLIGDPLIPNGRVDELRLVVSQYSRSGEVLESGKWIVLDRAEPSLAQCALMRVAAWPAMGKRFAFRDWLIFSEKFGIPLAVVKYDDNRDDEKSKQVATEIVRNIGGDGGAVIPKDFDVEIIEAGRTSDNASAHGGLSAMCNAEMSKLINGSTLSSDTGGGGGSSYAMASVHDSVRWDNVIYDAACIEEAFRNQVFIPFMIYNGMDPGNAPSMHIQVVRDQTPSQRTAIAKDLHELGIPVSVAQIRQETGFRSPIDETDSTDPTDRAVTDGTRATDA